jgi:hypothetical protein
MAESVPETLPEIQTTTTGLKVFPSTQRKGNTKYTVTYKGFWYLFRVTGKNKTLFRCAKYPKGSFDYHARIHLSSNYKTVILEPATKSVPHNHP